jgi:subtilisin family serine protease
MAQLTHAQKKSFAADMPGILRENKDAFAGMDFNPENRATELDTLNTAVTKAGGVREKAEADLRAAVAAENGAIDAIYTKASAAVDGVSSTLGKDHALTKRLRNMRDLMVNEAARGKTTPAKPQ